MPADNNDLQKLVLPQQELSRKLLGHLVANYAQKPSRFFKNSRMLYQWNGNGWHEKCEEIHFNLKPFFNRKYVLSILNGLLCLYSDFIGLIIPETLKSKVLSILPDGHWDIGEVKQPAKQHVCLSIHLSNAKLRRNQ